MTNGAYLFAYGTLMSEATDPMGREQRLRLRAESTWIGPGRTPGHLFDLGHYPGLAESCGDGATVQGEVVRLHDAAASMAWLDLYEGIEDPDSAGNEYRRVERPVTLTGGGQLDAWLYLYVRNPSGLWRIESGRWCDRASRS